MNLKFLKSRKLKYGAFATVMTVVVAVVLVLVNAIVMFLSDRLPLELDLTDGGIYNVTSKTIDFLKTLDSDVTITVLAEEDEFKNTSIYHEQANEMIRDYQKYSSHIKVEYKDLISNPEIQQEYSKDNFTAGDVMVESEKTGRMQKYSINEMFNFDSTGYTVVSSKVEQIVTSAIISVTDSNPMTVTVLTGFDEADYTPYTSLLKANGYQVVEQNLLTEEEINPDAVIALIPAPRRDYSEAELAKLDKFLTNDDKMGKTLIYFAAYDQGDMPNLDAFLSEWGIEPMDGILYETDPNNYYINPLFGFYDVVDEEYAKDMPSSDQPILQTGAKAFKQLYEESGNRSTSVLLNSSETAVLSPLDADENWDPNSAEKGTYCAGIVGTKTLFEGSTELNSHVVALGSITLASTEFMEMPALNNGDYVLSMTNALTGKKNAITIVPKNLEGTNLDVTAGNVQVLSILFIGVIPGIVVILGIVTWIRRRNK